MEQSEIKIEIFGRVQGVGFRRFVKDIADSLDVKGLVKNKDSGSVLIVAKGEKKKLEDFLEKVRKGTKFSNVEGVSYMWGPFSNTPEEEFIIALDRGVVEDQTRNFVNLGKRVLGIQDKIPKHVAIIPDGNRRWAKQKGLEPWKGHEASTEYNKTINLFEKAKELGVKYLTLWAFSTENWNRSKKEIDVLFELVSSGMKKYEKHFIEKKIRFRHIGRKDRLPKNIVSIIDKLENKTKDFEDFNVQICLDYGGRDEILRAVNKVLQSGVKEIVEDDFKALLDSSSIPDPDLIIRTSGEQRMSGFMTFQSAYSEFYFADVNFPDFGPEELEKAIAEYGRRKRNFGK